MSDNKIEIKSEIEDFPTPSPKKVNTQLSEVENTSSVEIKDTSMLHSSSIKKVVVTGVTGQDGSHMVEYLLKNTNCMVYGTIRRLSVSNHENIEHLKKEPRFQLVNLDLTDDYSIRDVIVDLQPDYFLNFAAQSFVDGSWDYPIQTWDTDATAVLHMLESIRKFAPECRFYNAGSSEEFGDVITDPQTEEHPLRPQSPYGAAKAAARQIVRVYRESYDLYAVQGWLFNHEGSRRGKEFVTRKISHGIAMIKHALEKNQEIPVLRLGNMDAQRDWTDAEDFMSGVWLMMNQDTPKNYVLASGKMHSVRKFLEETLKVANIDYIKVGKNEYEKFIFKDTNELIVEVDPKFYRPAEVHKLRGDCTLAEKELGWKRIYDFNSLVKKMYKNDYNLLK
jgi:GDPmannose 4,6-dehydratase